MERRPTLTIVLSVVIVLLLGASGYLFWKYQQASKNPNAAAQETSARVINKVSKLYLVPTDEEPTVAQIQDKSKLGNQEFFKTAENGDYLLIYQNAKVALVYREASDKLVTVGPVNIGDKADTGETAGATTDTPSE